ncbi:hypothetical protein OPIT5_05415 [Opitutaceae bacterium TAV5]|nr:hypothetical protein OPIT5_05415 [Opitutaceae bacterium TAV5]
MKTSAFFFLKTGLLLAGLLYALSAQAQINVFWGNSAETVMIVDSSGNAMPEGSLIYLGIFSENTDFGEHGTDLTYLLDHFTLLASSAIGDGGYDGIDGYFSASAILSETSTQLSYWIFNSGDIASATEWSVTSSALWTTPASIQSILTTDLGQLTTGDVLVGILDVANGLLKTAAGSAVPEPFAFAALAGLAGLAFAAARRKPGSQV